MLLNILFLRFKFMILQQPLHQKSVGVIQWNFKPAHVQCNINQLNEESMNAKLELLGCVLFQERVKSFVQ